MTHEQVLSLIGETFEGMQRSGMIPGELAVSPGTVILGNGSVLDSLGFVTFISDLEERLSEASGKELILALGEIYEFNAEEAPLSVGILADFIERLAN